MSLIKIILNNLFDLKEINLIEYKKPYTQNESIKLTDPNILFDYNYGSAHIGTHLRIKMMLMYSKLE